MEGMPYKRTKIEKEKKRELEKLVLRTITPYRDWERSEERRVGKECRL